MESQVTVLESRFVQLCTLEYDTVLLFEAFLKSLFDNSDSALSIKDRLDRTVINAVKYFPNFKPYVHREENHICYWVLNKQHSFYPR